MSRPPACGERSVLSRWTATFMFALGPRPPVVDVGFTHGLAGRRPGIRSHRITGLAPSDVVVPRR